MRRPLTPDQQDCLDQLWALARRPPPSPYFAFRRVGTDVWAKHEGEHKGGEMFIPAETFELFRERRLIRVFDHRFCLAPE